MLNNAKNFAPCIKKQEVASSLEQMVIDARLSWKRLLQEHLEDMENAGDI